MSDFMREVDQDYRRERTMRFLSRYQILIAIVVIAIVGGAGGWRYAAERRVAAAEADNSRLAVAETEARDGVADAARKGFSALVGDGVAGYPLLAGMREAEELAATDPEGAAKRLDAIALGEGGSQAMRDAARYRGAVLRVDREDPKAFEGQYGRFAVDTFAFHAGMRELLALTALKRGEVAVAQRYLGEIAIDGTAPAQLRNRAQAFLELAASGAASGIDKAPPPATITTLAAPAQAAPTQAPSPAVPASAPVPAPPAAAAPVQVPAPAPAAQPR